MHIVAVDPCSNDKRLRQDGIRYGTIAPAAQTLIMIMRLGRIVK